MAAKEKGFKMNSAQTQIGFESESGFFFVFMKNNILSRPKYLSDPKNVSESWYKELTIVDKVDIQGVDALGNEWLIDVKTIGHVVLSTGRRVQTLNVLISSPDERGTEYLSHPGKANLLGWYSPGRILCVKHEDLKDFVYTGYNPLATYRRGDSNTTQFYRNHKDETWRRVPVQQLIDAGVPMIDLIIDSDHKVLWDMSTGYDPMRIPSHG